MTDTTVVVFGSPKVGTLLMQCKPSVALELPLKFLFYKDGDKTVIAYEDAKNIAARYGAQECEAVGKLSGAQANLLKEVAQYSSRYRSQRFRPILKFYVTISNFTRLASIRIRAVWIDTSALRLIAL